MPVVRDMKMLEQQLRDTRQELHNLQVMVLNPKYSPEDRELFILCERSCRAQVKLRRMAIEYQRSLDMTKAAPAARTASVQLVFDFGRRLK